MQFTAEEVVACRERVAAVLNLGAPDINVSGGRLSVVFIGIHSERVGDIIVVGDVKVDLCVGRDCEIWRGEREVGDYDGDGLRLGVISAL